MTFTAHQHGFETDFLQQVIVLAEHFGDTADYDPERNTHTPSIMRPTRAAPTASSCSISVPCP